ncbi:MAG: hydroxylamine reductase [Fusobacteriaceae bacterium]
MFCYQCQETIKNQGCNLSTGACGKKAETSDLQDLLIYTAKGVAAYSSQARAFFNSNEKNECSVCNDVNLYLMNSLFITITNANFDDDMILDEIKKGLELRKKIKNKLVENNATLLAQHENKKYTTWNATTKDEFLTISKSVGTLSTENEDVRSLRSLILFGLKGLAAYTEHAFNLGKTDSSLFAFIEEALLATENDSLSAAELTAFVLKCGEFGVKAMALLDSANTSAFGNPEVTKVKLGVGKNPGILISGHDLWDLKQLLEQTEGTGVDVYTHSEMLPGHYYPELKKHPHFVGNYGGSWWHQKEEFASFNGPILFTTNCIVPPLPNASYQNKVFTTNAAGYPGWKRVPLMHNGQKDFSEIISLAKTCPAPTEIESGEIIGGFAHNQVIALADKVIEAVKSGAIKKFVVMAGCDGRNADRNYYTEFAEALPHDTVILTAGCAKYRYNKLNLGDINGIPRVLDAGQCNDSYSLAVIAMTLQKAFGLDDINKLPIIYNIAWYEQKAVIVLLALLSLGVKNIHLGPTLPAFLSPNIVKVLVDNFGIAGIETVEKDLAKWNLK